MHSNLTYAQLARILSAAAADPVNPVLSRVVLSRVVLSRVVLSRVVLSKVVLSTVVLSRVVLSRVVPKIELCTTNITTML